MQLLSYYSARHDVSNDAYAPFSQRIMVSEIFRSIPKVWETFGKQLQAYIIFTYVFNSAMPFLIYFCPQCGISGPKSYVK